MPYQIQAGSFLVVVPTLTEAIRLYDSLRDAPDGAKIRDMDGREIGVERVRTILNDGEPS
ncbi:hypothetical protein [Bradyrhizobium sp. BR 10289]|uniref:hypothetical protein n=1 Tax=Bradyrhizobium sp. BR 10289 TaxID=2749993 RepID=UPI001C649143|nr:hypothetical protein [Bradyrhizobium sp. BR 10289]MBW7973055.1 hypothetical protein [Bradyrhizobium sp. BR 10289]